MEYQTVFGSLEHYEKGGVQVIDDDPKHYVFSNVFEVASKSKPYEKVCVGKNLDYVLEVAARRRHVALVRGRPRRVGADHGRRGRGPLRQAGSGGRCRPGRKAPIKLAAEPKGKKMGWVKCRRGHQALLPKGAAYQFRAVGKPGVIMLQTIKGDLTVEKWAEICQTK